jgi:hypothetical protein
METSGPMRCFLSDGTSVDNGLMIEVYGISAQEVIELRKRLNEKIDEN